MPSPQMRPILDTLRKILPRSISAARSHSFSSATTQSGIGTVRMCPLLPNRSTMAQWSFRCCRWSSLRLTASCRLRPHARSKARRARSRFPLFVRYRAPAKAPGSVRAVNQFPRRTPSFLDAFDTANTGRKVGTEKATSRRLHRRGGVRQPRRRLMVPEPVAGLQGSSGI